MPATTERSATGRRESPARRRVLDVARELFYAEGIHAVGIDRIIAEAGVAKATFYHHFPSKDELVRAYLAEQSGLVRRATTVRGSSLLEKVTGVFDDIGEITCGPGFRGCAFVNAAAEYPDPGHPVRAVVDEHRRWFRELLRDVLADEGHPDAERTAWMLALFRDGVVVGADLDDPSDTRTLLSAAVTRILADAS